MREDLTCGFVVTAWAKPILNKAGLREPMAFRQDFPKAPDTDAQYTYMDADGIVVPAPNYTTPPQCLPEFCFVQYAMPPLPPPPYGYQYVRSELERDICSAEYRLYHEIGTPRPGIEVPAYGLAPVYLTELERAGMVSNLRLNKEGYYSLEDQSIRDAQIRLAKKNHTFEPPARLAKGVIQQKKEITMQDFLEEWCHDYGLRKWGNSFYSMNKGLIRNYINPFLGERYVRSITVRDIDSYYAMLLEQPAVVVSGHHDTGEKISAHTVSRIHKLLNSAFNKAVVWEYADINPTKGATLPAVKSEKRAVWSDEEAIAALNVCEHSVLRICLYLALGCSMRLGEILGLQWSNVHIEPALAACGEAYLRVDRELHRCTNESIRVLEEVNRSTIILKFPPVTPKMGTTTLVLKAPKTESSYRTIYLPMAVIEELNKVKAQQAEYKEIFGDTYQDYDLVVCQINGRPYEIRNIDKMFYRLIEENQLRPVVFHSLRHSSTSLKLKLSRGNIKAVQGDTGHAEARMVTDTYAHGFDADRKLIAQEMDNGFFAKVGQKQEPEIDTATLEQIKNILRQHPELLREIQRSGNG